MKKKLPKKTHAQRLGTKSQSAFRSTFSGFCSVIPIPQEEDLGLDFDCQILKNDSPTGIHFKVQCKGTGGATQNKDNLRMQIKTKTVNYWNLENCPIFLIILDDKGKKFYWLDSKKFIRKLKKWKHKKSLTFSIPKKQSFGEDIKTFPKEIENIIVEYELPRKENTKYKMIHRGEKKMSQELRILEDKLWFDRHQLIKDLVASGKFKIKPQIWKLALRAEKKMIKKYGKRKLGPWTDFEWGMINGKISALRWLFGDEWDSLDS